MRRNAGKRKNLLVGRNPPLQGDCFDWDSPISVPKRKLQFSQSQLPFQLILFLRRAVIGCLAVFFLVPKLGGPSENKPPHHSLLQVNVPGN